jgi:hypothetical protein
VAFSAVGGYVARGRGVPWWGSWGAPFACPGGSHAPPSLWRALLSKPSVGCVVHYVAFGTPGGEYPAVCRAAVVTEVPEGVVDPLTLGLCVLNPTGMFFNRTVPAHPGDPAADAPGARCAVGDRVYPGGTWHWPEFVS